LVFDFEQSYRNKKAFVLTFGMTVRYSSPLSQVWKIVMAKKSGFSVISPQVWARFGMLFRGFSCKFEPQKTGFWQFV
jgi:hypothetical protein